MITVVKTNGDVLFFNEREHTSFAFSKEQKKFWAYPTQDNAKLGMIRGDIELADVDSVTYTNEAKPVELTFNT